VQEQLLEAVPTLSVSQFTDRLDVWFKKQAIFDDIAISGEISNLAPRSDGSLYFALKDARALLSCFSYASTAKTFASVKAGSAVIARGSISVRHQRSGYSMLVKTIRPVGIGELYAAQEDLRQRFEAAGFFATERKRPLPAYPFAVALVSREGADAENDFRRELQAGAPNVKVITVNTPVQGVGAGPEIGAAIDRANTLPVDAIALVRGGGSFEDLFVFSTEPVVRAIVRSKLPIITGIGHHAHTMLCDLVADLARGTPTAAAAFFIDRRREAAEHIANSRRLLQVGTERAVAQAVHRRHDAQQELIARVASTLNATRGRLRAIESKLRAQAPLEELGRRRDRLMQASLRLREFPGRAVSAEAQKLQQQWQRLMNVARDAMHKSTTSCRVLTERLYGNDPAAILNRGYAIVRSRGKALRDARAVAAGDAIDAQLARGALHARVESVTDGG